MPKYPSMMIGRVCASISCLVLLSSCGSYYKLPADTADPAQITVEKGYQNSGLGSASLQIYAIATENVCSNWKLVAKFAPLSGSSKSISVEPDRQFLVGAFTNFTEPAGTTYSGLVMRESGCTKRLTFTPARGESYKIVQRVENGRNCRIEIVSERTGLVPDDAREIEPAPCSK